MHMMDSTLSPLVAGGTTLIGLAGFSYGLHRMRNRWQDRSIVLMGSLSAFLFAAQMVNIPLPGTGASGHLLGGVLAAVLVGPWAGTVAIGTVLLVQCLLFADGGLTAWGANTLNMGLIGCGLGYLVYSALARGFGGRRGVVMGATLAAWFTVPLSAAFAALEISLSGQLSTIGPILSWMVLIHAAIGVLEATLTGLILQTIFQTQPDLIPDPAGSTWVDLSRESPRGTRPRRGQAILGGLVLGLAVCVFLAPLASAQPDGLEWVGHRLSLDWEGSDPAVSPLVADDYLMPGVSHMAAATAIAGILGTLVVFAIAWSVSRVIPRSQLTIAAAGMSGPVAEPGDRHAT